MWFLILFKIFFFDGQLLSFSKTWFIDSGLLKRKKPSTVEHSIQVANVKATNPQLGSLVAFWSHLSLFSIPICILANESFLLSFGQVGYNGN